MMRTLARALADLQAAARDAETSNSVEPAARLVAAVAALEASALAPFTSTAAVRVSLGKVRDAARAYAAGRRRDPAGRSARFAELEAALYRLAMAADAAPPDGAALSARPDYDRAPAPNPIARSA